METRRILVVEDHAETQELLRHNLTAAGFEVRLAPDGPQALALLSRWRPDLALLDLMLPGMDGLEICRRLKQDQSLRHIPVIMLTARDAEVDRVVGLELGAEDYVVKPFSPRELVLRIKLVLRRSATAAPEADGLWQREGLSVDFAAHELRVDGEQRPITATEHKILRELVAAKGKVLTRDRLLDAVWDTDFEGTSRTVDTHVRRLRAKLGRHEGVIETVRGVGYRLKP